MIGTTKTMIFRSDMKTTSYLRTGRKLRATGTVIERNGNMVKVKPTRDDWGMIWLTPSEIEAGSEKPPVRPREKREKLQERKPRQPRKKPAPLPPRWKQLVNEVRTLEIDHVPEGWPAIKMKTVSALADELEAAHQTLSQYLPIQ